MRQTSNIFKIIVLLLIGFQCQLLKAQETTLSSVPDARLYEAFGKERVDFLVQKNPDMIKYYNFFLDNSFVLVKHHPEKVAEIIRTVPMMELTNPSLVKDVPNKAVGTKSVNILKYKYQLNMNNTTQYRLDDSGTVIIFFPARVITEKYNKARNL